MGRKLPAIILFVTFTLALSFQNCSKHSGTDKASQTNLSNENTDVTLQFPSEDINLRHLNKCVFTLQGQQGFQWKVERHSPEADQCASTASDVQASNPNATIVSQEDIFQSFEKTVLSDQHYVRCDFTLQGQQGFQWKVEKYYYDAPDCAEALGTVSSNNPNATIVAEKRVTIGYPNGGAIVNFNYKCVFELEGTGGAKWQVERFYVGSDNCQSATEIVKQNNPYATINSSEEVYVDFNY